MSDSSLIQPSRQTTVEHSFISLNKQLYESRSNKMTQFIKTVTAQLTKAHEAVTLAKEIACYISIKFPAVSMKVEAEQLEDKLDVHFQVDVADAEALRNLHQQGTADALLQMLAEQFTTLFDNGRLQDIYT